MLVSNMVFMSIWSHTSEVGARRLRESYFASILRQDVAFFDNVGPGEIATRIETDTRVHFRVYWRFLGLILCF
jgi:ATP-binding cassette subfamily B (MDR/TAP) protein 1